jgi:hypothetical protein
MAKLVYQFRITLVVVDPPVWRVIRVSAEYTLWDLHVAIQDAMGWLDCHLHEFRQSNRPGGPGIRIGIPTDEEDDFMTGAPLYPGWKVPLEEVFRIPGDMIYYLYDFGDGWDHEVLLEGVLMREKGVKYPQCISGARATPPEDCGGPPCYENLLDALADPSKEEHREILAWLGLDRKNAIPFDPVAFDIGMVKFTSPARRLKKLMEE